jgi:hypothetical protein
MIRRAEVTGWKQPRKPLMHRKGVTVAIVVGAWESHVHGEGLQLERWVRSHPVRCKGLGILANADRALRTGNPLRRSPCAVKVARTVATGGMEKRTIDTAPCPDPLHVRNSEALET